MNCVCFAITELTQMQLSDTEKKSHIEQKDDANKMCVSSVYAIHENGSCW